jgi:predicted MFS family arabinose efflux permease
MITYTPRGFSPTAVIGHSGTQGTYLGGDMEDEINWSFWVLMASWAVPFVALALTTNLETGVDVAMTFGLPPITFIATYFLMLRGSK